MSVRKVLFDAMKAALDGFAPAGLKLNGVFEAEPVRGVRPFAVIEDAVLADWSTKDMVGREGRLTLGLFDAGEGPRLLGAMADMAVEAVAGMPRELGEGWRIASLVFLRSRVVRDGERRWTALIEWRVRMLQVN